jgi:hypothetical protein
MTEMSQKWELDASLTGMSVPIRQRPGLSEWAAELLEADAVQELAELADTLGLGVHRRVNGEVTVDKGRIHSRATCTCGWDGGPRFWRAAAIVDAHIHAAAGCELLSPLVTMARPSRNLLPARALR